MRVLNRYIVAAIGWHVALVLAGLMVLLGLFLFIEEQGWVGVGRYGNLAALRHVLLNLPATGVQFLPVAALLGALLALGQLARGSELTVMRAAGVSVARLAGAVLIVAVLLVPLAVLVGEWLAPPLAQFARVTKAVERDGGISLARRGGAWLRDGDRILRARGNAAGAGAGAITVFTLGEDSRLESVGEAGAVRALPDGAWELAGLSQSQFGRDAVQFGTAASQRLELAAGSDFLDAVSRPPRELPLMELARTIRVLQANGQDARAQRFAFWSGIARLAAIPLALLLALPFALGPLRDAGQGGRALLGLTLGLAWFFAQRTVENGTIALGMDPLLAAWLPTLLLGVGVGALLARVR